MAPLRNSTIYKKKVTWIPEESKKMKAHLLFLKGTRRTHWYSTDLHQHLMKTSSRVETQESPEQYLVVSQCFSWVWIADWMGVVLVDTINKNP